MEFATVLTEWTRILNERYGIQATEEEVHQSFNENLSTRVDSEGGSYVDRFLKLKDGTWDMDLDTDDRETLLDGVRDIRKQAFINASTVLTVPVTFKILSQAHATEEEIHRVIMDALERVSYVFSPRAREIQIALLEALNKAS
jgi:hypothetical protein